ncbi:hypothetical protein MO973_19775 [Paenibacillus sp. TRM 82003]|nr:hypothetical protein [Paenibacillus sp. TRM 82003]
MFDKKRLGNYGLWVAVTALLIDLAIYSGLIPLSQEETITMFIQRTLEILITLGILSNPTNPNGKGFNL